MDFSGGMVSGVDDLERMLRDAIKTTFEARAAAYDEQVLLRLKTLLWIVRQDLIADALSSR